MFRTMMLIRDDGEFTLSICSGFPTNVLDLSWRLKGTAGDQGDLFLGEGLGMDYNGMSMISLTSETIKGQGLEGKLLACHAFGKSIDEDSPAVMLHGDALDILRDNAINIVEFVRVSGEMAGTRYKGEAPPAADQGERTVKYRYH